MSNHSNNEENNNFDRFIKSCSNENMAWKFFLRKNLRSRSVNGNSKDDKEKIAKLQKQFKKSYSKYFMKPQK